MSRLLGLSHNIMDGQHAFRLFPYYKTLGKKSTVPVGFCCIQEDVRILGKSSIFLSHAIAAYLGPQFRTIKSRKEPRLATIYNSMLLRAVALPTVVPLPRLETLPAWNKLFIRGGKVEQKQGLVIDFQPTHATVACTSTAALRVVNFHLDAAGDNKNRLAQLDFLSKASASLPLSAQSQYLAYALAGDTNIFHPRNSTQQDCLKNAIDIVGVQIPLNPYGPDVRTPTHWFSRADEPMPIKQVGVFLGEYFGLDLPQCYDVILAGANITVHSRSTISTADASDHDLVLLDFTLP